MGIIRAPLFIVMAHFMGCAMAATEGLCPAAPFETDINKIAATIAADPLKPGLWDATAPISASERLTDGAVWTSAGGLGSSSSASLDYDAKRYLVVYAEIDRPQRELDDFNHTASQPEPIRPIPNQVIRRVGDVTYTTTTARPTPEQARQFACLANRLLVPPLEVETPKSPRARPHRRSPPEITITAHPVCNSGTFTDGHTEGFELLSSRLEPKHRSGLPCDTQLELRRHLEEVAYAPINEVIERGKGTWRSPHVHSLAVDAAANLYLLIDPGTGRGRTIEVRRVTPSGEVTPLSVNIGEPFYAGAFTVDGKGHAQVPVAENTGTVIYDIAPGGDPDSAERQLRLIAPDRKRSNVRIDAIAAATDAGLYAMSGLEVIRIAPTGSILPFADSNIGPRRDTSWYFGQRTHIVVASDGTIFVSDATSNIILEVSRGGTVTILAGTQNETGTIDGPGNEALFNSPQGLALDREGNLYVADSGNETIRCITPDGTVSTFAGKPGERGTVDGQGGSARFDSPNSIAIDRTGTLYVTNGDDNRIRKVSPAAAVSTLNAQQFIDAHN